ncbi:MAG: DegT/DnrJ/EryC1/StrS family aminotransferase [Acidimicrobiales bacterium]
MPPAAHQPPLAILGADPRFPEPLHVGRPNLGDRQAFLARIEGMLDRNWLTNDGPLVQEMEREIAGRLGVAHCVAMTNGTVALEIAIRALGLTGEVIVPGFTFVATAHALQWQEITPVFADVDPITHTLDPARVSDLITPKTSGILGVHLWGIPCDVDALAAIAADHGLELLFDAAHAFGCARGDTMIGGFGRAEVLSFHATKFVNSFEGGAVVTNDTELAERMVLMRNFGFAGYDRVIYVGTNGKMSEPSAAMALTNLESMEDFVTANRANFAAYRSVVRDLPGLRLVEPPEAEHWNHQYVVVEVDAEVAGLTRDELVEVLWADNVRARRYFYPGVHRMEPYRSHFPHAGLLLPVTERLCDRVLVLPTGTAVSAEEVGLIGDLIATALAEPAAVRAACKGLG